MTSTAGTDELIRDFLFMANMERKFLTIGFSHSAKRT